MKIENSFAKDKSNWTHLLIPILWKKCHWNLLRWDRKIKKVEIWDSLYGGHYN
jgi:hypothetical protein